MSRRVFMHIDEYGNDGFAQLPHILCLSDPLIAWAPSAILLESAGKAGATDLTSKDILSLIESEHLRVIAREEWFSSAWRNRHPFSGARWVRGYDDVLADFANVDTGRALEHRRVIVAKPEVGYDEADQLLNGPRNRSVRAKVGRLFKQSDLPQGTLEKANRDIEADQPYVRTVLRDFFNHVNATHEAGAAIAATPCERFLLLASVVSGARATALTTSNDCIGSADTNDVREAVRLLKHLTPCVDKKRLFKFLKSNMRRELQDLFFADRGRKSLEHHLVAEIGRATAMPPFLTRLLPKRDPIGATVTIGGLTLAVAAVILGTPGFGLLPVMVEALKGPAIRRSLIPAPVPWGDKTRALFYLSLGTKRPTLAQVEKLCTWLP